MIATSSMFLHSLFCHIHRYKTHYNEKYYRQLQQTIERTKEKKLFYIPLTQPTKLKSFQISPAFSSATKNKTAVRHESFVRNCGRATWRRRFWKVRMSVYQLPLSKAIGVCFLNSTISAIARHSIGASVSDESDGVGDRETSLSAARVRAERKAKSEMYCIRF